MILDVSLRRAGQIAGELHLPVIRSRLQHHDRVHRVAGIDSDRFAGWLGQQQHRHGLVRRSMELVPVGIHLSPPGSVTDPRRLQISIGLASRFKHSFSHDRECRCFRGHLGPGSRSILMEGTVVVRWVQDYVLRRDLERGGDLLEQTVLLPVENIHAYDGQLRLAVVQHQRPCVGRIVRLLEAPEWLRGLKREHLLGWRNVHSCRSGTQGAHLC